MKTDFHCTYSFIIPVFNHGHLLKNHIEHILSFGLKILIIDDGSNERTKNCLQEICAIYPEISMIVLEKNAGKGAALKKGFEFCREHGITHALQIDADGQHDLRAVPDFLAFSHLHPNAVVAAYPLYDKTVPAIRKKAREITNFFVSLETLTSGIRDAMIGFRMYPVEAALRVFQHALIGSRMTIDLELLVRLYWAGCSIAYLPVKITYPPEGSSNFRMVRDNVLISLKHTQLMCRMLYSFPLILLKNAKRERL